MPTSAVALSTRAAPAPTLVLALPTTTPLAPTSTLAMPTAAPVSTAPHPLATSPEAVVSTSPQVPTSAVSGVPVYTYRIVHVYPHDPGAWTQGLLFEDGVLYEGTGRRGQSTLRRVELETGGILQLYTLPAQYYGEGCTIWGDEIVQLTWKAGLGFVYDKASFDLLDTFRYSTEGWGITHDGIRLIMSDGTATLRFWNPETFEELGHVLVHDDQGPVSLLNELEYVEGKVYANVWPTDRIAIINPSTGQVAGWIDLAGLLAAEDCILPCDVLNGIAYDAGLGRLFVTGKLWPKLFEIELVRGPQIP